MKRTEKAAKYMKQLYKSVIKILLKVNCLVNKYIEIIILSIMIIVKMKSFVN